MPRGARKQRRGRDEDAGDKATGNNAADATSPPAAAAAAPAAPDAAAAAAQGPGTFMEHHYAVRKATLAVLREHKAGLGADVEQEAVIKGLCSAADAAALVAKEGDLVDLARLREGAKTVLKDYAPAVDQFVKSAAGFLQPVVKAAEAPGAEQAKPTVKAHRRDRTGQKGAAGAGAQANTAPATANNDAVLAMPPAVSAPPVMANAPIMGRPPIVISAAAVSNAQVLPPPSFASHMTFTPYPSRSGVAPRGALPAQRGFAFTAAPAGVRAADMTDDQKTQSRSVIIGNVPPEQLVEHVMQQLVFFHCQHAARHVICGYPDATSCFLRTYHPRHADTLLRAAGHLVTGCPQVQARACSIEEVQGAVRQIADKVKAAERAVLAKLQAYDASVAGGADAAATPPAASNSSSSSGAALVASLQEEIKSCQEELELLSALGDAADMSRKLEVLKSIRNHQVSLKAAMQQQQQSPQAAAATTTSGAAPTFSSSNASVEDAQSLLYLSGFDAPWPDAKLLLLFEGLPAVQVKHVWRSGAEVCIEVARRKQAHDLLATFLFPVNGRFCGVVFSRKRDGAAAAKEGDDDGEHAGGVAADAPSAPPAAAPATAPAAAAPAAEGGEEAAAAAES